MRFPADFLDELRARLPVSEVVGARVKLRKAGREWKGLSPFQSEKTPSFTVNDAKAFWHDFSTGAHGDVFDFTMRTEGCEFPEAVERLARLAGMAMPQRTPEEAEKSKRRAVVRDLHEAACLFFERMLHAHAVGATALAYLAERGIDTAMALRFRLGWAPRGGDALKRELIGGGADLEDMIDAGLVLQPEGEAAIRDRFVGRVIFPIADGQGRIIAFAGRAVDEGQQPKYLNSPETPTFQKGRVVYNLGPARRAAHAGQSVFVVEGYTDVIAMTSAGFEATVCTMGTAITSDQLQVVWRFAEEPAITLDGDAAGQRASARVAEVALPFIGPGRSIKFVRFAEGVDPDTVLRAEGPEALRAALSYTASLAAEVWTTETASREIDTPEKRAALEARLRDLLRLIKDAAVRRLYGEEFKANLAALYSGKPITGPARRSRFGRVSWVDQDSPQTREYHWLVKDLLPANETACITGESGSGKTFEAFNICMHVALGRAYRGRRVQQGLVVYAAPEGGVGLVDRMRAYRAHYELPLEGVPFEVLSRRFNIYANEADVVGLIEEICAIRSEWEAVGINLRLIVIDTWSAATAGMKENQGDEVGVVRARIKRIEEACGCGVVFVHHLNAAGERARGHGSIIADIDTELRIEKVVDAKGIVQKDDDDRELRRLRVKKQREGRDGETWDFVLRWVWLRKDDDGDDVGQCVSIEPNRPGTGAQPAPRGRQRVDGTNLSKTEALFFRAVLDALDDSGIPTPAVLQLPSSITRVVDWAVLSVAYRRRVPSEDQETPEKYRSRVKSAMRFAREKLAEFGVIGVDQVGDRHVVWPTGKRVVGPNLIWPSIQRVVTNTNAAPDLLENAEPGDTPF